MPGQPEKMQDSSFRSRLKQALARDTASREILQVISQSRHDEAPVFDAILRNAARLCEAPLAYICMLNAARTHVRIPAQIGARQEFAEQLARFDEAVEKDWLFAVKAPLERAVIRIDDLADDDLYRSGNEYRVNMVDVEGMRSVLVVPIVSGEHGLGCIILYRRQVAPFSDEDVELVRGFAAQAAIAIENVRQFRELQTRLEREKASREILLAISASRTDPAPVFEMILRNAAHLSGAPLANLCIVNESRSHWHLAAHFGDGLRHLTPGKTTTPLDSALVPAVAMRTARIVHIEDLTESDLYRQGDPGRVAMVEVEGMRTILCVPLLVGSEAIGCITLFRREVKAFTDDEIALVETFAAQAVIAIENVNQFRELQERLRRERASADVLKVISQSRHDENPVFNAILENACALCNAPLAGLILGTRQDAAQTLVAHKGMFPAAVDLFESGQMKMDASLSYAAKSIIENRLIALEDMGQSDLYHAGSPIVRSMVDDSGIRSVLFVPLTKDGQGIGNLTLFRREVKPFDQSEISLVETFAAQAVIAIENVRQFREVQTRLERERASAEVLEVISTSRENEAPVFDLILKRAAHLCDAFAAALALGEAGDTHQRMAASYGVDPRTVAVYDAGEVSMNPDVSLAARAIVTCKPVHVEDMSETEGYKNGVGHFKSVVDHSDIRTNLFVPLITDRGGIGALILFRKEVRPYTQDEIALVETFAAQAVIAIENVRQFKALETLNAELGDRVEAQVGEIERMGKLKRFLPAAVADTVVSSGSEDMLKSHRALLGVLFCDIRGFTAFCETAEPEETIEVLQTYHQEMGKLIDAHGAGVDHRMGDGIMVLFNDPVPCDDPAGDAVRLAIAMRERMAELSSKWKRLGYRLGFGVGVSLGYATVGMVGFEGRFDYTASGTAVNLAARLCDEAADGEILLSPRAAIAIEDDFDVESRGEIGLKGIREPLEVFRLGLAIGS